MSGHTPWREIEHEEKSPTRERLFVLTFKARWVGFLPWPSRTLTFSKVTTWADAHEKAEWLAEATENDVTVEWHYLESA